MMKASSMRDRRLRRSAVMAAAVAPSSAALPARRTPGNSAAHCLLRSRRTREAGKAGDADDAGVSSAIRSISRTHGWCEQAKPRRQLHGDDDVAAILRRE
jgi:hypothetical protein